MKTSRALQFLLALLFVGSTALGNFYDQRPDILKATPQPAPASLQWTKMRDGHFVLLAQLLTFFPDADFYFLARDIEYLYDISKVLFKDHPEMLKRLHIVPVSTSLSYQIAETRRYLEQEGVTKERLKGRTALFVDSCCAGSVPDRIKQAFSGKGVDVKGFLIQANAYPNSTLAAALGTSGIGIEGLPHHTNSASAYVKENGRIRVQSTPFNAQYGGGNSMKEQSKLIQQDIRYHYDNAQARDRIRDMTAQMRIVYSYVVETKIYKPVTLDEAATALKILSEKHNLPIEPLIADMLATTRKGYRQVNTSKVTQLRTEFLKKNGFNSLFYAKKIAKNPHEISSLPVTLGNDKDLIRKVYAEAIQIFVDGDIKKLEVKQTQLRNFAMAFSTYVNATYAGAFLDGSEGLKLMTQFHLKYKTYMPLRALLASAVSSSDKKDEKMTKVLIEAISELVKAERAAFTTQNSFIRQVATTSQFSNRADIVESIMTSYLQTAPKAQVQAMLLQFMDILNNSINWPPLSRDPHLAMIENVMTRSFERFPDLASEVITKAASMYYYHQPTKSKAAEQLFRFIFSHHQQLSDAQKKMPVNLNLMGLVLSSKDLGQQKGPMPLQELLYKMNLLQGVGRCQHVYL